MKKTSRVEQSPVRFDGAIQIDGRGGPAVRATLSPYAVPVGACVSIEEGGKGGSVLVNYLGEEPLTTASFPGGVLMEIGRRSHRPYKILVTLGSSATEKEVGRRARNALTEYSKRVEGDEKLLVTINEIKSFLP